MNEYPQHFADFGGSILWTTWKMLDGCTMAGSLVTPTIGRDAFTVLRVDGTTCHVPTTKCHPATVDDILRAGRFYATTPLGTDPICQLPLGA